MLKSLLYKSFSIGKIKGIEFKIHWSFIFLIFLCGVLIYNQNLDNRASIQFILLFVTLFLSVFLHEFGHAITAKYLNVKPKDVIISALGGLARIESLKDYPKKEILIASAGPFVNFIIFIISLIYILTCTEEYIQIGEVNTFLFTDYFSIAYKIGLINLLLFGLNLIPAFPMDGGRILRAFLSLKYKSPVATKIACTISRIIALGFFILGAYTRNYSLLLISALVYLMAVREL